MKSQMFSSEWLINEFVSDLTNAGINVEKL